MNYKEKYEQALKMAQETYNTQPMYREWLEKMFPELAESEDEKVRNGLVRLLKELLELGGVAEDEWDRNECEKYIAWLEKQGEKKPADSYCQENCKGFQETGKCFVDGDCKDKREAEISPNLSEEDERNLQGIIDEIEANKNQAPDYDLATYDRFLSWLKSLKGRVQPKVELTRLDKNILEATIAFVEQNNHFNYWGGVDKQTVLSVLRSLRPQK